MKTLIKVWAFFSHIHQWSGKNLIKALCEVEKVVNTVSINLWNWKYKNTNYQGKMWKAKCGLKSTIKKKTIHKSLHKICEINGYMKYGV